MGMFLASETDAKLANLVDKIKRLDDEEQHHCLTFANKVESFDVK